MVCIKLCSPLFPRVVLFLCVVSPFIVSGETAVAAPWGLPLAINDKNTEVGFEIDSTWHIVHGTTTALSGRVWLDNEDDYSSVRAELSFPVRQFNTDNDSRDERMREVMQEPKYPAVSFEVKSLANLCSPEELSHSGACQAVVTGEVKIRDTPKMLEIPVQLTRDGAGVLISGSVGFEWSAFGVEDPSIFIARLDKTVTIKFRLHLPALS